MSSQRPDPAKRSQEEARNIGREESGRVLTTPPGSAAKPLLRYARKRDRLLARVWPPFRRKLEAQQRLADYYWKWNR